MKKRIAFSLVFASALFAGSAAFAQFPGMAAPKHYPWSDKSLTPDQRADMVIKEMTLDEKIQLLHGPGWMVFMGPPPQSGPLTRAISLLGFIPGIPRLGIPDLQMTDSNQGISGIGGTGRYATAFPSGESMASGWDPVLSYEVGTQLGHEMRDMGFNMSLGSGINMIREPRDGRTFEYKGEDPLLAGTLAGSELKAEKALHLITDLKHYAVNDQDAGRIVVNSIISKRAMRESDLLAFKIALRDSDAGAFMCSYNKINGTYACENPYTLGVLKNDWGFKGFVVSDWGGTQSTVPAAMAGLDIEMPGNDSFGAPLKKAVEDGEVPMDRLNDMVHRILRTEFDSGIVDDPPRPESPDVMEGFKIAQKTEERGAVLLKNVSNVLPLNAATIKSIAVIGGHADAGVMSGGGSSQVSPAGGNAVPPPPGLSANPLESFMMLEVYFRSAPLKGIEAMAPHADVAFDPGTDPAAAAALAKKSQVAIVFATQHESEGMDLKNLSLPGKQDALIEAVAAANPHTIVVLETGGAVLMPWIDKVAGVLEAWYPGIRGSQAIANLLFGDVNPSGHLPLTFPVSEADLPHPIHLAPPKPDAEHPVPRLAGAPGLIGMAMGIGPDFDVHYDEGLKVGYKWYDAEKKPVLFPFGFGLSYTTFAFSGLSVTPGDSTTVSFMVKNTGKRAGTETAQVYASLPAAAEEPPKRLVGWTKVELAPGESKQVSVPVSRDMLSIYDEASDSWKLVPGDYVIHVGGSSRDLPLEKGISF